MAKPMGEAHQGEAHHQRVLGGALAPLMGEAHHPRVVGGSSPPAGGGWKVAPTAELCASAPVNHGLSTGVQATGR